jgi:hypothetical protein
MFTIVALILHHEYAYFSIQLKLFLYRTFLKHCLLTQLQITASMKLTDNTQTTVSSKIFKLLNVETPTEGFEIMPHPRNEAS